MKEMYSVSISMPNPLSKPSKKILNHLQTLDGIVSIAPNYPIGILVLFDSLNNAKIGRNSLMFEGAICGKNICKFETDDCYQELKISRDYQ